MSQASPELCVGGVVVHEGRLLLVRRGRGAARGLWSVPGGRVEPGETLERALRRELMEETSLGVRRAAALGWVERIGEGFHFVIHDYLVEPTGPERARAGDDAAALSWVPLDGVARWPDLVPGLVEFLARRGVIPGAAAG